MKMVFVSNFLSHHQRPLTDVLAQECDFAFIATTEFHQERRDMGWEEGTEPDYLCHYDRQPEKARALSGGSAGGHCRVCSGGTDFSLHSWRKAGIALL